MKLAAILDAMAVAHPSWPFWVHLIVATGFELAVLSTGLAVMLTGDRWLAAGELALLAVSVACGWWTILCCGSEPPWIVVAATLAWLPVQYLIGAAALIGCTVSGASDAQERSLPRSGRSSWRPVRS